jgi:hypothetical protein
VATTVAAQLEDLGYNAVAADAGSYGYENCVVYAPRGMKHTAEQFVSLLSPAELKIVPRSTAADGITVVVGTTYDGQLAVPEEQDDASVAVTEGRYDEAGWRGLDAQSPMVLQMPSVWGTGLVYDQFRAYRIERPDGRQAAAAVAVGRTPRTGYFSIQAMRWTDPPAIAHPSATKTIGGTKYLLFYNGAKLHMVAWRQGSNLYWVLNTLEDELPADFMMALATSFEPIDPPSATPQPEASPSP